MFERKIVPLSDEEVSLVLFGLRCASTHYKENDDIDYSSLCDDIYRKIDDCYELGVISNEKIKY